MCLCPVHFFNTIKILFYLQSQQIWHLVVYLDASLCLLSHCVACGGRKVIGGHLFFFLFSLPTCQIHHCPLWFLFFNPSPYFFNFLFRYRSFYISFFVLQFIVRLFFHSSPFFYFFLSLFVQIFLAFNFIFQSKFLLFYFFFNLTLILFICFSFC